MENLKQFSSDIDLHTPNMAFILSNMNNLIKKAFTQMLGEPEMSYIQRNDEKDLKSVIPAYIVKPTLSETFVEFSSHYQIS